MGGVSMSSTAGPHQKCIPQIQEAAGGHGPRSAMMSSTVCRRTSGSGIRDCRQIRCMWVAASMSVLMDGEGLGIESSRVRVWSTCVASSGSRQKSGRTMESLMSPLGWTRPNPFSGYL